MKKRVFQKCKTMQICGTVVKKQGFARFVREREFHQKSTNNESKYHPKIDEKSMQNPCPKKYEKTYTKH